MEIKRDFYLNQLIEKKDNGRVKIITGIRRSGKSYLLFELFDRYLRENGVDADRIIKIALDEIPNIKYRNPIELDAYIRGLIADKSKKYYVMIDEIQLVSDIQNPYVDNKDARITFTDVILGLMKIKNADIYVTGSNSKMLSSDVLTQFRDRGDEIRVYPLSYAEFYSVYDKDKRGAWNEYCAYGGMPLVLSYGSHEQKSKYLRDLAEKTYIKDVIERNNVKNDESVLEDLLNIVSSAVGSLTNPSKLSNTFKSEKKISVSADTIEKYLGYFTDAFIIQKSQRYDVKGRKYIKTPMKYYFTDVGLRNARLGFRQQEQTHIMENVIYSDLKRRGYDVDVGAVEYNYRDKDGKKSRKQLEVDFVVNRADNKYYIQSALTVNDEEKRKQETESLLKIPDSFKKIIVTGEYTEPWRDDNGILYVGVEQFLLNKNPLDI